MANDRHTDTDARTPPRPADDKDDKKAEKDRDRRPRPANDELDEGLDETFPASDPPAPSRPTGET
jgi:hypothetical protein